MESNSQPSVAEREALSLLQGNSFDDSNRHVHQKELFSYRIIEREVGGVKNCWSYWKSSTRTISTSPLWLRRNRLHQELFQHTKLSNFKLWTVCKLYCVYQRNSWRILVFVEEFFLHIWYWHFKTEFKVEEADFP